MGTPTNYAEGPILLIEDDPDDMEIALEVLGQSGVSNRLITFTDCKEAFSYLSSTNEQPFLIVCDINMHGINGLEFKQQLDNDPQLKKKSIPFIFYSTSADPETVRKAYTQMTVQGFFRKESNLDMMKETFKAIFDYWRLCKHPNTSR